MVLNSTTKGIIEEVVGQDPDRVFVDKGLLLKMMNTDGMESRHASSWGSPVRIHDLKQHVRTGASGPLGVL